MQQNKGLLRGLFILVVLCFSCRHSQAQSLLYRRISVQAHHLRLENVLDRIGQKCGFSFSYNSNIIPRDSLVNISVTNEPIKDVLDLLFGNRFEYKEAAGYIILRYAPLRLSLITDKVEGSRGVYRISGFVVDDRTGEKITRASVYEKKLLRSALTDANGSFELKINTRNHSIALTVSKELYRDTTVLILPSVNVRLDGSAGDESDYTSEAGSSVAERTAIGRLLVSYRQKIQELNVPGFIAESPVQASITPGLSSHGMLSGQVINNLSLNILGGYTAGVEGVEAGGLFNINKKYTKGVQAAGLFNLVGMSVTGVQAAGVYNGVLDSVKGIQAGGLANFVIKDFSGIQAGGIGNFVRGGFSGVQAAGLLNFVLGTVQGVQTGGLINISGNNVGGIQVAGLMNAAGRNMDGMQVSALLNIAGSGMRGVQAGVVNFARKQMGFQFGLVNVADTSAGVSIGLINIVRKNGVHSLSVSSNEIMDWNLVIKTGTPKFYTIIQGARNLGGIGFGREYTLSDRLSLNPEILGFYLYQGSWDYTNSIGRINLILAGRINKFISVFAGPSFNVLYSDQDKTFEGYELVTDRIKMSGISGNEKFHRWIGWNAGITLF